MPPQSSQSNSIPPPPPGYTLDSQSGAIPPPPAGYTLDSTPSPQQQQPEDKPGFFKRLGQSLGIPTSQQELAANAVDMLQHPDEMIGPGGVAKHLLRGYGNTVKSNFQDFKRDMSGIASDVNSKQIGVGEGLKQMLMSSSEQAVKDLPVVGQTLWNYGGDIQNKNYTGAAGGGLGFASQVAGPKAIESVPANSLLSRILLMGKTPEAAYESALKPSTTLGAPERLQLSQTGLKEGIPVSQKGLEKLSSLIDDVNSQIAQKIQSGAPRPLQPAQNIRLLKAAPEEIGIPGSDPNRVGTLDAPMSPPAVLQRPANMNRPFSPYDSGVTVDPNAVVQKLNSTRAKFSNQVNPESDLTSIDQARQEFLRNNPDPIPASQAQAMKQGTYRALGDKAYGELKGASIEAQKALARGLKDELANQFPELNDLNARDSRLLDLQDSLERAVGRIGNHQLIGIGTPVAAGAVKAISGSGKLGAVAGVMKSVLDNPAVKSKLAIALAGKGTPGFLQMGKIAAYSAALGKVSQPPALPFLPGSPASRAQSDNQSARQ